MPWGADPNFGFLWNKDLLSEAGLDDGRGPVTTTELDSYMSKLTKFDSQRRVTQYGCRPWNAFGGLNTIMTWGWAFGGDFYDEAKRKVTADHPRNVAAMKWLAGAYQRYGVGPQVIGSESPTSDFFTFGHEAMRIYYSAAHLLFVKQAAQDLKIGAGPLPHHPAAQPNPTWVGGWAVALAAGARNRDAAFEYMRWMWATPEGTAAWARVLGWYPAYRKSSIYEVYRKEKIG